MGTTYGLIQGDYSEIELDEASNKLTFCIRMSSGDEASSEQFTPEQVMQMALTILKVCSYWTEPGTVEKTITEFKSKGYHW